MTPGSIEWWHMVCTVLHKNKGEWTLEDYEIARLARDLLPELIERAYLRGAIDNEDSLR